MWIYDICGAFEKAQIRYAVVGGYALTLHGAARGTIDLDLVIELTKPTFLKAEKALIGLGFESRLPVTAAQVHDFRKEYILNRNLVAWSFFHPGRQNEIIDIIITDDARKMKVDKMKVDGHPIRVASLESLIEMKRKRGRPQDLIDVAALETLKKGVSR
ncbi:MAG: nucleotidyl transferase AbiEii/AbiGii toxin family protein [Deltaproteobacteria bacterium]|nr:nucleotidyl transferase AbiEii/AbiGii toxin family protein [Deltaproteobacteria bacterium]